MEGAQPAQATRAGECLPTAGQSYVVRDGDLDCNPRSPAAATVYLQPEPTWTGGWQLIGEEARELKLVAGQILRPHNELRPHLRRVEARPGRPCNHGTSPFIDRATTTGTTPAMRSGTSTGTGGHCGGGGVLAGTVAPTLG